MVLELMAADLCLFAGLYCPSQKRTRIKCRSLMCFHCERLPDCISLSDESDIFPPSPLLKRRQMGSEVISKRRLRSLNCTLACLCIPRWDVTIIGPNGNRCRVPRDVASGARRAACQASGFAADHLQFFIRVASGIILRGRCQEQHPSAGGKVPPLHRRARFTRIGFCQKLGHRRTQDHL